jgi:hypothetical protein
MEHVVEDRRQHDARQDDASGQGPYRQAGLT